MTLEEAKGKLNGLSEAHRVAVVRVLAAKEELDNAERAEREALEALSAENERYMEIEKIG